MRIVSHWPNSDRGPTYLARFRNLDEQLRLIRSMIRGWSAHPAIRRLALRIVSDSGVNTRDKKQIALAIGRWVQDNITYIHELPERFSTPEETLATGAGDCDDMVILGGALMEAVGVDAKGICQEVDGQWRHIFLGAVIPGRGVLPIDPSLVQPVGTLNPVARAMARGKRVRLKFV